MSRDFNAPKIRLPEDYFENLVKEVCATYKDGAGINLFDGFKLPHQQEIVQLIERLLEIVFPGYRVDSDYNPDTLCFSIGHQLQEIYYSLNHLVVSAMHFKNMVDNCKDCDVDERSDRAVRKLLDSIATIRETAKKDVRAAYEGDPAALNQDEIVLSYPGIRAITIQRFAHVLYTEKVPLVQRMMTEHAHSLTGIDIHPGAKLGAGIFIDHGTGVVIGETAVLGDGVKIYQGVTLGALSFPKDACGMIIKGRKRHPTIENNVTIYAGASVLGDVVIGERSVLGSNVWVTDNVPPGSKVLAQR